MRSWRTLAVALALASAACGKPAEPTTCDCVPGNASRIADRDGARVDGFVLLDKLRQHQRAVRDGRPGRDVKLIDDELRQAIANFCDPCNRWVPDRVTIDELYPLDRLDDAARAVCLGFELHDGTTVYGAARPRACR